MADAVPISGKRKAVSQPPALTEVVERETPLAKFPDNLKEAAQAALDAGRKVELTSKGFLRIYG